MQQVQETLLRKEGEYESQSQPLLLIGVVFFSLSLSISLVTAGQIYKLHECTKYQSIIAAITQFSVGRQINQ